MSEVASKSFSDAESLLVDLVSTPSLSGEEGACADRLTAFFETHGREVYLDAVGNVRAPGDDRVLLTSHIDTVPGTLPVKVEDGTLWGRGSVDATGSLAAMAVAAVTTGASFAGVVREETDSAGAAHLIDDREAPAAVINGEPSGWDGVVLGYRGVARGTYHVTTTAGHAAGPGQNAIELALSWIDEVTDVLPTDEASVFESATVTPVSIDGGLSDDGTAVEATIEVDCRLPPSLSPSEVLGEIDAVDTTGTVSWARKIPPVTMDARNPVATSLRGAIRSTGGEPRLLHKTGTSDMNLYATAWEVPMATYGPGDSSLDHTTEERLDLDEFSQAIEVLESATITLQTSDHE